MITSIVTENTRYYIYCFQYLKKRFGTTTRTVTSVANYINYIMYTGVVLYAPSLAMESTTGLSSRASVLLIGLICMFYSAIGGIKAVLITDVFQGFLMFVSLFCVLFVAFHDLQGDVSDIWDIADKTNRLNIFEYEIYIHIIDWIFSTLVSFSLRIDPTIRTTLWTTVISGVFSFLAHFGVNQVIVQRLLTVKYEFCIKYLA